MKATISEIADRLMEDKCASRTAEGARALAELLNETTNDASEEFDLVAIRCAFTEYESALEAAKDVSDYKADENDDEEEKEAAALAWLEKQTSVIKFDDGVVIQQF